jgi:hypothetical protein
VARRMPIAIASPGYHGGAMGTEAVRFLVVWMAGWVNSRQLEVIDFLREQPSPRPKPSAAAENALLRPSGASALARASHSNVAADRSNETPPASAIVLSPARRLWQARCTATSEEEKLVSTASAGPRRPRRWDSRPDRHARESAEARARLRRRGMARECLVLG